MNKNIIILLFVLLFLSSCWNNSPYKGYTKTGSGLYYKLQTIGDGKSRPYPGCFLQLRITYKTIKDSIFFDTYFSNETGMVILPFNHSSFKGSFEERLTHMNAGDSVSFIVNADSLFKKFFKANLPFFILPGSLVKMEVELNRILTKKECQAEMEKYDRIFENREIEEPHKLEMYLERYLDTTKTYFMSTYNGMYYLPLKTGEGDSVKVGDLIKINYRGCFLDGKQFESTYDRAEPLEFVFGQQGQVIQGFTAAISMMNVGAKTRFIIPSALAYGETGSSTCIVPPFTTVVYEIEVLSLTKHKSIEM